MKKKILEDCCGGGCGCHDVKVAFDAYYTAVRQNVKEVVNNNEICKDLKPWGKETLIDELTDRLVGTYRGGK